MTFSVSNLLKTPFRLDPGYIPIVLANNAYIKAVNQSKNPVIVKIALIRNKNQISTTSTIVFHREENQFDTNYEYIERLVKTLLWIKGGWKIIFGGPKELGEKLKCAYLDSGERSFDAFFMSNIFEKPFEVEVVAYDQVPDTSESSNPLGRHLEGYRIGFDAGGSDRKVSAVVNGKSIYSEEIVWHPKLQEDPQYHYQGIMESLNNAASKMPRVDAIGVSAAGIYIDNRVSAASLFIRVPKEKFDEQVRDMFLRIAHEFDDVPIEVANDGDVTALAGAMSLGKNKVLGIAMGTSQAAGYVDEKGNITGWLNELAFVPVDFNHNASVDEWSLDYGCGVKYFSQDAVIRLAETAGIDVDSDRSPAEKLSYVQSLLKKKDPRAEEIFDTIGCYLGYSIAYYASFYDIESVLILGRVSSGNSGQRILEKANEILKDEFPELSQKIKLILPDELSRRVGQSIAAASLPQIRK